ncbi:DUF5372 family protein, partial [Bradyrhizobium sp. CIR3A]|uniref:DUF5372 family protein n=1 Tax=Bradyrhizobium sp. CIR3A TaxID=2663838 RepID=UPI001606EF91
CNSVGNASGSSVPLQLVTVTHPFHPYSGQRGACVGRRGNRAGKLLLLRFDDGRICSVPPQWTDAAGPSREGVAGDGRALCGLTDLLALSDLVERLTLQGRSVTPKGCKGKSAANVREITPQSPWTLR